MIETSTSTIGLRWGSISVLILFGVLSIVGSGGNGDSDTQESAPITLNASAGFKQLQFSWNALQDATYYNVLENPDGGSGFTPIASNLLALNYNHEIAVHFTDWLNASYIVDACNGSDCVSSNERYIDNLMLDTIGYIKASNTDNADYFGARVALSTDGSTLAVGAYREDSAADEINGDHADNTATDAGAVYVFARSGNIWQQQAYIKALNSESGDNFGWSVALSADGSILAVGAVAEDSATDVINGDHTDNTSTDAGAVYIFTRSGNTWQQQAYIKASNAGEGDYFGVSIDLSADGNTLVVGAGIEDSAAEGIDGDQNDNTAADAGAVYVFTRSNSIWQQQAYIKASNTGAEDRFGWSVALSGDGDTLVAGARAEDSSSEGIDGDQADNSIIDAGAVYVFIRSNNNWQQQAYIKASNTYTYDWFGGSVSLSGTGDTLAVAADVGFELVPVDNGLTQAGAVYVFIRNNDTWQQQACLQASNSEANDRFGSALALSNDGDILAVGTHEDSAAVGVGGDPTDNSATGAGAAYVFIRTDSTWQQRAYVKASNTEALDFFGWTLALNGDGNTLAVGAHGEGSAAVGIGGDQLNNTAFLSGAVYLY